MKQVYKSIAVSAFVVSTAMGAFAAPAPKFKNEDYKKALWMTGRFYGAQRSGDYNNWLIAEHDVPGYKGKSFIKDADGSYDLTGGWFDCGDHVKFGQTEFYSAYTLILGYSEFPGGYEDYYSQDYSGYISASDYTWEGGKGKPNGIPDILDEVKHATDYFLKVVRDENTFYYQVGEGDPDHKQWVTSPKMSTLSISEGGEAEGSRKVFSQAGNLSDMASLCAATLASMSRLYKSFDPAYAAKCLEKALVCYDLVNNNPKGSRGTGDGGFYGPKGTHLPDMVCMDIELYRATGENKYLEAAYKDAAGFMDGDNSWNHNWSVCYTKSHDYAYYLLGTYGSGTYAEKGKTYLTSYVERYKGSRADKCLFNVYDMWGALRYPAAQAFMLGLYDKMMGTDELNEHTLRTIEYIMGSNSRNFSYIVGFGENSPIFPHHRNYFGDDQNNMKGLSASKYGSNSYKYRQFGFLAGGSTKDGEYPESLESYQYSEGGIDYNAGLVSALGYINSKLSPVDANKFGHPTPDLGKEQSICGKESIELNSGIAPDGKKVFTWLKDGQQVASGTNESKYNATSAGEYTCRLDSAGEWNTEATVKILGVMPSVNLGETQTLCSPAYAELNSGVESDVVSFEWKRNNEKIEGAKSATYVATVPGKYTCTISAKGCEAVSGSVDVESKLPIVEDATSGGGGKVTLTVKDATTDDYEWYDAEKGGNLLGSGRSITLTITEDKTVYVQDAGAATFVAGPKSDAFSGAMTNWGAVSANFKTHKALMITGFTINIESVYNPSSEATVTAELDGAAKGTFTTTASITAKGKVNVAFANPIEIPSAGDYQLKVSVSNGGVGYYPSGPALSSYQGDKAVIEFVSSGNGVTDGGFPAIMDWQITAGSGCDRASARAIYDEGKANLLDMTLAQAASIYPNPAKETVSITVADDAEDLKIEIENMEGKTVYSAMMKAEDAKAGINISGLNAGVYAVRVVCDGGVYVGKVVKE